MSLFSAVAMAPRDSILGLTEQFNADTNPAKVNLGVGVYYNDAGKLPLLDCVLAAEEQLTAEHKPRGYLPIDGIASYDLAVQHLVFGADSEALRSARVATVQTLGGTGGLKVGADFLRLVNAGAPVLISDPTWENHRALFTQAGFVVAAYPYYDATTRAVAFDALLATLTKASAGTIVVLHACCHNPTGCDLSAAQWDQVIATVKERGLVAFLDMAYQGFGAGIAQDGAIVPKFLAAGLDFFVATSFSKSFSLYGERAGALSVVCSDNGEAGRVLSQLKIVIRANYSTPPTHGAQVIARVLTTPALRAQWETELAGMRDRIRATRVALQTRLRAAGVTQDLTYITDQQGMFSYTGLEPAQMQRLRSEFGVYGLDSGRICVAAINSGNLDHVVKGLAAVM